LACCFNLKLVNLFLVDRNSLIVEVGVHVRSLFNMPIVHPVGGGWFLVRLCVSTCWFNWYIVELLGVPFHLIVILILWSVMLIIKSVYFYSLINARLIYGVGIWFFLKIEKRVFVSWFLPILLASETLAIGFIVSRILSVLLPIVELRGGVEPGEGFYILFIPQS
jgi:hypothetical protein